MIKIAPLIHSRTYCCDFNTDFLVRPDTFMSSDIEWARDNILSATNNIDLLDGVRWLIIKKENIIVAGIVCFIKDLINLISLSDEQQKEANLYIKDDKGRRIYAFIGFAINNKDKDEVNIDFSHEYLLNTFIKYIQPVWNHKVVDTTKIAFNNNYPTKITSKNNPDISVKEINNIKYYETNTVRDKDLFDYYLQTVNNLNELRFCSNITEMDTLKEYKFNIVTTSNRNIERLEEENNTLYKEDNHKPTIVKNTENIIEKSYSSKSNYPIGNSQEKKNSIFINGTKEIINTIGRDYSTITIGDISYKLKDNSSNSSEEKEYLFVILVYEKSTSLFEKTKRCTESLKNKFFSTNESSTCPFKTREAYAEELKNLSELKSILLENKQYRLEHISNSIDKDELMYYITYKQEN